MLNEEGFEIHADVILFGPKSRSDSHITLWVDMTAEKLQDSTNWVLGQIIDDARNAIKLTDAEWYPTVYFYDGTKYSSPGQLFKAGKNLGGYSTLFHYTIISSDPITSVEMAERILIEAKVLADPNDSVHVDDTDQSSSDSSYV